MDTFEQLKGMILDFLEINEDAITLDTTWDEMGIDSVELVEFVFEVESKFGLEVSDDAFEEIKTLKDVVDYIEHNA